MRGSPELTRTREIDRADSQAHEARDRLDRFYEGHDGRVASGLRVAGNLVVSLATGQFDGSPELAESLADFRRAGDAKREYRGRAERAERNLPSPERRRIHRELAGRAIRSAFERTF